MFRGGLAAALLLALWLAAVAPARAEAPVASGVLTASLDGRSWQLSSTDLAQLSWESPSRSIGGDGGKTPHLDAGALRQFAERIATDVNIAPQDARVEDTGIRQRLVPARNGRAARVDELVTDLQQAYAAGRSTVTVPVDQIPPKLSTDALLQQLGVTAPLAAGDSDFAGSEPGRATNVRLAATIVNDTLVPPGGTFSYNHALGAIVETPGFVEAEAVEAGVPGRALGGGVCQISTTIFRAALRAGLPIVEWWPHSYRFPVYEQGSWGPGFDASIAQPDGDPLDGGDLKFANPTDHWLLVRVGIQGTHVTVQLIGAPTGYVVKLEKPTSAGDIPATGAAPIEEVDAALPKGTTQRIEPGTDGLTVTVVRHVFDAAGDAVATDSFVSNYQPRGPVLRVSPDVAAAAAASDTGSGDGD